MIEQLKLIAVIKLDVFQVPLPEFFFSCEFQNPTDCREYSFTAQLKFDSPLISGMLVGDYFNIFQYYSEDGYFKYSMSRNGIRMNFPSEAIPILRPGDYFRSYSREDMCPGYVDTACVHPNGIIEYKATSRYGTYGNVYEDKIDHALMPTKLKDIQR